MNTAQAYEHCESLTRDAAANFYYGIRLLPVEKRQAMCAVYAFARRIDDIGDGSIQAHEKLDLLDVSAESLRRLQALEVDRVVGAKPELETDPALGADPVMVALSDAVRNFPLPVDALVELIEGVRMDVQGTTYETFEDLLLYCQRVAGTIGRLCLAIFEARAETQRAEQLAVDLGVAMQLTNIVRDLSEDRENGRVYLPREDLVRYKLSTDGRLDGEEGQLDALVRFQTRRAGEWFDRGLELVPLLDRRSGACVRAMTGIYRRLLERIEEDPELARRQRTTLPIWEKAWVATRSLLTAAA